ncbi:MAG TPA: hypothetical protein VNL95_00810 [Dehalococcoidia bacterium]|nr:hypothetical protein [Dehalococcoidia bacterium]
MTAVQGQAGARVSPLALEAAGAAALAAALALPVALTALLAPAEAAWAVVGLGATSFGGASLALERRPLVPVGAFLLWTATQRTAAALVAPWAEAEAVQALLAYKEAMYLALLAAGLAATARRLLAGQRLDLLWADLLALGFLGLVGVHFLVSDAPSDDRLAYLRRWWAPCLLYLAGRLLWPDGAAWARGVVVYLALMGAVASFGLVERFALAPSFWTGLVPSVDLYRRLAEAGAIPSDWLFVYRGLPDGVLVSLPLEVPVRRLVSTFVEPTTLAFALALGVTLASGMLTAAQGRGRWAWAGVLGLLTAALVFTTGRGGILAALVGMALLALACALAAWRGTRREVWRVLGAWAAILAPLGLAGATLALGLVVFSASHVPARAEVEDFLLWSANMPPPQAAPGPAPGATGASPPPAFDHPPGSAAEGASRHLSGLREGLEEAVRSPLGLGLGRAGVWSEAPEVGGESTIGALAAQLGLPGLSLWAAFALALALGLVRLGLRPGDGPTCPLLALGSAHLGLLAASWFTESASGVTGVAAYFLLAGWALGIWGREGWASLRIGGGGKG